MAGAGRSGDSIGADEHGTAAPAQVAAPPDGTTELGIDIIRISRIAETLERFGDRFSKRVLTPAEEAYVRNRPQTMAG